MKRLLILAALCAGTAHAEFWDGNTLYSRLTGTQLERGIALGYIMGVSDALGGIIHCTPANVTAGQVSDMVQNFLANTPAVRHFSADSLVTNVLKRTWPCAEKGRGV